MGKFDVDSERLLVNLQKSLFLETVPKNESLFTKDLLMLLEAVTSLGGVISVLDPTNSGGLNNYIHIFFNSGKNKEEFVINPRDFEQRGCEMIRLRSYLVEIVESEIRRELLETVKIYADSPEGEDLLGLLTPIQKQFLFKL